MYLRCFVSIIALLAIGTEARRAARLLKSEDAQPGDFKYQVWLKRRGYLVCGGALISPSHVLTAAHCFVGRAEPPYANRDLVLGTGTTNITSGGERHYAKNVTVHPNYIKGNPQNRWRHDIAVVTLATPAVAGATQAPVALPSSDTTTRITATVSGWGQMQKGINGQYPENLQKRTVTVLPQNECHSGLPIFETQLCALDGKGTGFCNGDSGGPLVYNNTIIGVISFAPSCGIGYPDVYTRVWAYIDFIKETMRENS